VQGRLITKNHHPQRCLEWRIFMLVGHMHTTKVRLCSVDLFFSFVSLGLEIHTSPFKNWLCPPVFISFNFGLHSFYFNLFCFWCFLRFELFFNFFPRHFISFNFFYPIWSLFFWFFCVLFFYDFFYFIPYHFIFLFNFDSRSFDFYFLILFLIYYFFQFFLSMFYFIEFFLSNFGSYFFNFYFLILFLIYFIWKFSP
jgi:hypothetical protein